MITVWEANKFYIITMIWECECIFVHSLNNVMKKKSFSHIAHTSTIQEKEQTLHSRTYSFCHQPLETNLVNSQSVCYDALCCETYQCFLSLQMSSQDSVLYWTPRLPWVQALSVYLCWRNLGMPAHLLSLVL